METIRLDRLRIMVVEDNQHMMLIVKTLLRSFGFKDLVEARDFAEAWDRLSAEPLDVVVLDRMLGEEDGLDLVRRLRSSGNTINAYVPVIVLSAHSERSRVEEARDAGVTEFCRKPVSAKDLFAKMAAVIDRPRPFVRTRDFFGPDRRRHDQDVYEGDKRRQTDGEAAGSGDGAEIRGAA